MKVTSGLRAPSRLSIAGWGIFGLMCLVVQSGCSGDDGASPNPGGTQQSLSVSKTGSGGGTVLIAADDGSSCQFGEPACPPEFNTGAVVVLTATPDANSIFSGWSGSCAGSSFNCTVTMDRAQAVTAQFNLAHDNLQISLAGTGTGRVTSNPAGIDCGNFGGASAQCSQTVVQTTQVTLTAEPQTGSRFQGWSGGSCSGSSTTCALTIAQATSVTATFDVIALDAPVVSSLAVGQKSQGQLQGLGMTYYISAFGVFPTSSGTPANSGSRYIGQIMLFAPGFAPAGWLPCDGTLFSISQNAALFSLIGTTFGGDGQSTFATPDLRARVPMGLGALTGFDPVTLLSGVSIVPQVDSIQKGDVAQGQIQGLGINFYISLYGTYPSSSGGFNTSGPYFGQVMLFAGNFAPAGWKLCDGSLLPISTNQALFSLLGTMYGGDGQSTFALPDLRARAIVGAGAQPVSGSWSVGSPEIPLTQSMDWGTISQGQIGVLGMNSYIALSGVYPSQSGGAGGAGPYIGQLMWFAGNFAPAGWSACDGGKLPISTNTALFSLLGTEFGGDGQSNFALPDLRARAALGSGSR